MKILLVSSFLPYPLINGGNIRLFNLLKQLSKKHEITLICERRNFQTDKDIEEVKKYCKKVLTVRRKKQWSFLNILKTGFSFLPFLVVGHTSSLMKDKIKKELDNNDFDLIHVETFYVFQNLPKTKIPVVLVEHNIEYDVYERYAANSNILFKPLLLWDTFKLKLVEKRAWKKATKVVSVSEDEKKVVEKSLLPLPRDIFAKKKVSVVPNGVDERNFVPTKSAFPEKRVLFIGDFKWIENRVTAQWILKEIWPKIYSHADSNVKLWIVGKDIPNNIRNLWSANVIFDENVKDAYEIYKKSYLLLSPIRVGGGTSFKILEALSCGLPVVTTKLGASGISSNGEIITGETTEEIAQDVIILLNNSKLYEKISKRGRKLIEEKFTWKESSEKLDKVYNEVSSSAYQEVYK